MWRRRWEAEFSNRRLKINCFCNNTILLQVLGDILSKKENRPKIIVLSLNIMIFIFSGKKFDLDYCPVENSELDVSLVWRTLWLCDYSYSLLNVSNFQRVFSILSNLQKMNEIRVLQFKLQNNFFWWRFNSSEDTI